MNTTQLQNKKLEAMVEGHRNSMFHGDYNDMLAFYQRALIRYFNKNTGYARRQFRIAAYGLTALILYQREVEN